MESELILHKHGAEAKLFYYNEFVIKHRVAKTYRIKEIDDVLTKKRTRAEFRIIEKLSKAAINVPKLFHLNKIPAAFDFRAADTIVMQRLDGATLKEYLEQAGDSDKKAMFKLMGALVSQVHGLNIVHGDLTSLNLIVCKDELFLIDFGLSFVSAKDEDKAVDLYVFEKSLICTQDECYLDSFYEGYGNGEVLSRLEKVRQRGRKREECAFG